MKLSLSKRSNLTQRVIAGVLGASAMISLIIINEWTFFALFACICVFALYEFFTLVDKSGIRTNKVYGIGLGLLIFIIVYLSEKGLLQLRTYYIFFPFFFLLFVLELFLKREKPFQNIAFTLLGVIYVAFPISLLNIPAFIEGAYTYKYLLAIIILNWSNDTGAYFTGKRFGRRKLFERISPKKTWEGSVGGTALTLLVASVFSIYIPELNILKWVLLGLIIVVFGSLGDLVESQLKRSLDIKDSGGLIPGHGGFLDRFDSLLISTPFIAAFFKIFF